MRLHSVTLCAFGPYATEQVIDFERLASSGLFLLEGPTGAGKTTVLDAVTFALYGGLSGEGSGHDRLHSDFAAPDAEPSVTVEFSLRGQRYRIWRMPEHQRLKKRGDGYTTQAMQVHLQRLEHGSWVSLSSNKAEVGDLVTEAVGLSRAQFTQVMLLPQGEFARFLRCGDDERRALLTKLFGTELYDRITAELEQRRTEATRARAEAKAVIDAAVSAAAEAAGLDTGEREELCALPGPDRAVRLKEIAADLATAVTGADEELSAAQARLAAAREASERSRQQAGLMTRLTAALAKLREHEATRPGHEERTARLAAARQAEPVRPLLAAAAEAEAAAGVARAGLLRLVPEPAPGLLAGQGGPDIAARAEQAAREAAQLQHLVDEEAGLAGQEAALAALQQDAGQAATRVAELAEARGALPERIGGLEAGCARARAAAAGGEAARGRLETAARQLDAARQVAELTPVVAAAQAELLEAVDHHQALVDEHQALLDARLSGMAAELAGELADGEPCPVCGSDEHPAPASADADAVSSEQVEEARLARDEAAVERERLEREHAEARRELDRQLAVADGRDAAELAASVATLTAGITAADVAAQDVARLEAELAAARAELEVIGDGLQAAREQSALVSGKATADGERLAALRARLAEAAQDHPSVAIRQAALRDASARDRELAAALDELARAIAAQGRAREQAEREAVGRGFGSLAGAQAAALDPAGLADLEAEVSAWAAALASLTDATQAADLAGLDPAAADDVQQAARDAAAELTLAGAAEAAAQKASDRARQRADRFGRRQEEVHRAEEEHDRLAERTEAVIRLAALAKGTDGQRRVALTTYVLRHWFSQVVAAANVRLAAMSAGRYELVRTDEAEGRRTRSGLTLSVIDRHTGEERGPASLSGGESFYTSLALALGLADVVKAEAGGVDLDTLFIDEGFGSLDADTLDQVMAVIDELRDRGRVVGIVSHVAELKDRVPERLEVRRLPDGSSTVRVVA
ncbi:MAG: AAA family ATPase [Gemmatimonadota bacterium]